MLLEVDDSEVGEGHTSSGIQQCTYAWCHHVVQNILMTRNALKEGHLKTSSVVLVV